MNWLIRKATLDLEEKAFLLPPLSNLISYKNDFSQLTEEKFKQLMQELEVALRSLKQPQGVKDEVVKP